MSLKRNLSTSGLNQTVNAFIGVAMMPAYLNLLGTEAYGLIGFFTMLQAWFMLLDLGLSATISRETARLPSGATSVASYLRLLSNLNGVFLILAVAGALGISLSSGAITNQWLKIELLDPLEVQLAIQVMAITIALRWHSGLYKGILIGAEEIAWLSYFNIFMSALKFVAVLASMKLFGATILVFFIHQLLVGIIEWLVLRYHSGIIREQLILTAPRQKTQHSDNGALLGFASSLAMTSTIWVLTSQVDRLSLSGTLSLTEYGHFSIAISAASVLLFINATVTQALLPRLTQLHAENRINELLLTYRKATQLVSVLSCTASLTLASCASDLLSWWTGDPVLAAQAAPILAVYAVANGALALTAFPYYLQYAFGNLTYHVSGNIIFAVILVPAVILATTMGYGGLGTGVVILTNHLLFLTIWAAFPHNKLAPGLHKFWLLKDIMMIVIPGVVVAALAHQFDPLLQPTIHPAIRIGLTAILIGGVCLLFSSFARIKLRQSLAGAS